MRPAGSKLRPVRDDHQQRDVPHPMDQQVHGFERRGIGPVGVLEQHHRRLLARDGLDRVDERAQGLVLEFLRRHRDGAVARLAGNGEHRGDEAHILTRTPVMADYERFELVEFFLGGFLAPELQGALEIVDDRDRTRC